MARMWVYRNRDNNNKYLDVRQHKDGRIYVRQFMRWSADDSATGKEVVNPTGDARLHIVYKRNKNSVLEGYEPIWTTLDGDTYRWIQKGLVGRYVKVKRRSNNYA